MGVLTACTLRAEVRQGDLRDELFAASFGDLIAGTAPPVYQEPATFFRNTHPAYNLRRMVEVVFNRLADPRESGATLRLSTGFGGGKTHTLMTLWHVARNIGVLPLLGTDLLPAAGRPASVTVAAIDAAKAGVPIFFPHADATTHSLWGELAYQLGGAAALAQLGSVDDASQQPDEGTFATLFPPGPVLILLDELVFYLSALTTQGQNNVTNFLNKLMAIVAKRPQTVLVVTDPADQRAFTAESSQIDASLHAARSLDSVIGRRASDFDPIGDEAAQVIVRRLFESMDEQAAQRASAMYHELYTRVARESPGVLPRGADTLAYAERILHCYPFHPRLLDTAQDRLGALQEFNKSRGTLRLFARILRTLWEGERDLELITAGDIDWANRSIDADLLQRLQRDNFRPAVTADIGTHAGELDGGVSRGVHRRAASALLLESIPLEANSGMDAPALTLAILRPDEAGHEPGDALNALVGVCWHTYPMPGGNGWQFRYQPNIIKQIEERADLVSFEDARSRVQTEAQKYFGGTMIFRTAAWPASPQAVPERAEAQLALCDNEQRARDVCDYADATDPQAPLPRRYKNAIVAVAPTDHALARAVERAQRLIAAEALNAEYARGDASGMAREQLGKVKPEYERQFRIQTRRAFDRVVLAGGRVFPLEERFLGVDTDQFATSNGQKSVRDFLDEKQLIYKATDALDTDRFLTAVFAGATPLPDQPGVITTKAVHERFLAAPGLRLLLNNDVVRATITRAIGDEKVVMRLPDGNAYCGSTTVRGAEGERTRVATLAPLSFALDAAVLLARTDAPVAAAWLRVDDPRRIGEGEDDGLPPPPPPPSPANTDANHATVTTWEAAQDTAARRPLRLLTLTARTPTASAQLLPLAQPLGANRTMLSVTVRGELRNGGSAQFAVSNVTPNHPTRPLDVARTLFTAIGEGAQYEAVLRLEFDAEGRTGMDDLLSRAYLQAGDGVTVQAEFGAIRMGEARSGSSGGGT